jgi:hypothetical protein
MFESSGIDLLCRVYGRTPVPMAISYMNTEWPRDWAAGMLDPKRAVGVMNMWLPGTDAGARLCGAESGPSHACDTFPRNALTEHSLQHIAVPRTNPPKNAMMMMPALASQLPLRRPSVRLSLLSFYARAENEGASAFVGRWPISPVDRHKKHAVRSARQCSFTWQWRFCLSRPALSRLDELFCPLVGYTLYNSYFTLVVVVVVVTENSPI